MEFELKAGPQGHIYLPKKVRRLLGKKMILIPNSQAVIIYPEGSDPNIILQSLEIIAHDLELQARVKVLEQ